MRQLILLIDNTLLLNKTVIYLFFIFEGRKTQLFVICQCFLSNNTSFIRLLFFGTFSLSTYISRNWFLHWLILSFRADSNQSVQFCFRLSLSLSLFLSVCVSQPRSFSLSSIHPFHPNVLVAKIVFAPRMDSAQRNANQRISWRNHHKTPLDLSRPIGENLLPFQILGSSVTLPAKIPKMQSENWSRVTQFFKTLWRSLLPCLGKHWPCPGRRLDLHAADLPTIKISLKTGSFLKQSYFWFFFSLQLFVFLILLVELKL